MISFNTITNGRLIRGLVRLFGMKISGSPAPTLAPEITPGYEINNWDDPTAPFLQLARLQSVSLSTSAAVGQQGAYLLRNPINSGVLVVVEYVGTQSAVQMGVILQTTNLGFVTTTTLRDFRWFRAGLTQQGSAIASADNLVAPLNPTSAYVLNAVNDLVQDWVIPPGCALYCNNVLQNVGNQLIWKWREIPITAEELVNG